jgi:hypothetical protein
MKIGAVFPPGDTCARLRIGRAELEVVFASTDPNRTIVLDPALQDGLAKRVAQEAVRRITWQALRRRLLDDGCDVRSAEDRGMSPERRGSGYAGWD